MIKKGKPKADNVKRLGKSISKNKKRARSRRARKNSLRANSGSNAGRTVAVKRDVSPLARVVGALRTEKIRFQLIGMSAAVLQGVPVVTHDIDLWIDLLPRQYMRAINV